MKDRHLQYNTWLSTHEHLLSTWIPVWRMQGNSRIVRLQSESYIHVPFSHSRQNFESVAKRVLLQCEMTILALVGSLSGYMIVNSERCCWS